MVVLSIVRALYDFCTYEVGDLQFKAGDLVLVLGNVDQQWLHGETVDGTKGIFPRSFVFEEKLPSLEAGEMMLIATSDFSAQTPDDLTIHRGDLIVGKRKVDNNWWYGDCNNKRGIFPSCFARPIIVENKGDEKGQLPLHGRALASLKAQLPGEVSLEKGEDVVVEEFIDQWWCRGRIRNQHGIFPRAFVEIEGKPSTKQPANQPVEAAYGISKFKFNAQYPGELSFEPNRKLFLIGHVDKEWTLCKLNGATGIVPTNYLNIVVDCPVLSQAQLTAAIATVRSLNGHALKSIEVKAADCIGKTFRLTHSFTGKSENELSASADDYVRVCGVVNSNWFKAVHLKTQRSGVIPSSILAPISPTVVCNKPVCEERNVDGGIEKAIARSVLSLELESKNGGQFKSGSSLTSQFQQSGNRIPVPPTSTNYPKKVPPARPATLPAMVTQPLVRMPQAATCENQSPLLLMLRTMLQSEKEYLSCLNRLYTVCSMYAEKLRLKVLIEKLSRLIDLSSGLISSLEPLQACPDLVLIGEIFNGISNDLGAATVDYTNCVITVVGNLSVAVGETAVNAKAMMTRLDGGRASIGAMHILCRPAQQLLKYPLYLSGILKFADPTGATILKNAINSFHSALKLINENKCYLDTINKYRAQCEESFAQRLSRFSLHSMMKKSSRLSVRLSSSLGLTHLPSDALFEDSHKTFLNDAKNIRLLQQHVHRTLAKAVSTVNAHRAMAEAVRPANSTVVSQPPFVLLLNSLKTELKVHVQDPMEHLQNRAKLLTKLIEKRQDKLFDCKAAEARLHKATKAGDRTRVASISTALRCARSDYNALNGQLIAELAQYHRDAMDSLRSAQAAYVEDMRGFTVQLANDLQVFNGQRTNGKVEKPSDGLSLISFDDDNVSASSIESSRSNIGNLLASSDDLTRLTSTNNLQQRLISPAPTDQQLFTLQPTATDGGHTAIVGDFGNIVDSAAANALLGLHLSQSSECSATVATVDIAEDVDEFCYVMYDFRASSSDELSVTDGQLVVVHSKCDMQGNDEWWLVETEVGDFGYVPAAYLKPYTVF